MSVCCKASKILTFFVVNYIVLLNICHQHQRGRHLGTVSGLNKLKITMNLSIFSQMQLCQRGVNQFSDLANIQHRQ